MKRIVAVLVLCALLSPQISLAMEKPDLEFHTPIVQSIIAFFASRIDSLNAEIAVLKQRLAEVPTCKPVETKLTPQEKSDKLNALEAQAIKSEYAAKFADIDAQVTRLNSYLSDPLYFECGGYGCPVRAAKIKESQDKIAALNTERRTLLDEMKVRLASVGVY